jgi:MFS family permease
VQAFLCLGLGLMGVTYGPIGTALAELFPTAVRYTGASLTFNLAGIFGASLAPYIATKLATDYGLAYVGYYMSAAGAVTLLALEHEIPFPLLADVDGALTQAFGVRQHLGRSSRVTFLIDAGGIVRGIIENVDPGVHADDVLARLTTLGLVGAPPARPAPTPLSE